MKRNFILLFMLFACSICFSQYIGVRARYTETRLVDNSPEQPSRENHLILSFFEVNNDGSVWTPANLINYDVWLHPSWLQYGNQMGGILDSNGNNYPGYSYTAPRAVAYYNTIGVQYVDCYPDMVRYVLNGHELDCGFIRVSFFETDPDTGIPGEYFTAPNIALPYYVWPDPYFLTPGNLNFNWGDIPPGPPYNWYSINCGGPQGLVIRGLLGADSSRASEPMPVNFAYVRGEIQNSNTAKIFWSNMTESSIDRYEILKSVDNTPFVSIDTIAPKNNNSDRADYEFSVPQFEKSVLYKIKAVEFSGKAIYSSIINLRLTDTNGPAPDKPVLSVFPNPVTNGQFTLRLTNAKEGRYLFSMVTPNGQIIKQKMIIHSGGDMTRSIDLTGLPRGIYGFRLQSNEMRLTQKILIAE